jgi:hypothetical protein
MTYDDKTIRAMQERIAMHTGKPPRHWIVVEDDPPAPMAYDVTTVVDVRAPGEAQPGYAADWLREWMTSQ